jgi:hypothetical protein
MTFNTVYQKLTGDPNDLVGAFAYIIYKQQKVDFCKSSPNGTPSPEELKQFHAIASLDTSIAAYRAQGEAMAQAFLNASLDELVERTELDTRQDTLYKYIGTVEAGLDGKLQALSDSLQAKRTIAGWARDVSGNLLVNLATILVIGSLVFGYKFLGELQQNTEKKAGIASPNSQDNSPTSSISPVNVTPQ